VLAELGLTYPQYVTMIALWETGGPVSVGDLGSRRMARRFGADPGQLIGLKRILDSLVEALDPTNGRR
jgi:hypothetical protein